MSDREPEVEVTVWAGRLRPWPAPPEHPADDTGAAPADDDTVRAGRAGPPEDATAVLRRREPAAGAPDEATALSRRLQPADAAPQVEERTVARIGAVSSPQASSPAASPPAVAPADRRTDGGRRARVPDAGAREVYRPRATEPARAVRRAAVLRAAAPPVDVHAATASAQRRRRRRFVVVVALGAAVALLAAAAIVAIAVLPG